MNTKSASMAFGIVFVLVGILGFIPNPLVAPHGVFAVNLAHNLVHILTGVVFILGATHFADKADMIFKGVGAAYVVVTIVGFMTSGNMLLGLVHINQADRWLHLGLAVVILAAGFMLPNRPATSN